MLVFFNNKIFKTHQFQNNNHFQPFLLKVNFLKQCQKGLSLIFLRMSLSLKYFKTNFLVMFQKRCQLSIKPPSAQFITRRNQFWLIHDQFPLIVIDCFQKIRKIFQCIIKLNTKDILETRDSRQTIKTCQISKKHE